MFHLFIKKFLNKKDLSNENVSPTSSEKKILFKLPIEYIDSAYVHSLSPNVANDLELADF
jgi:hypothetical protein